MTILPKVLLLDEPLAHVDPRKRLTLRRELRAYHRSMDIITLFVTHILPDAFALADRVAIMNSGKIIQFDSARNIQEHPVDSFVRDFVECFEL
jgi:ABC-type sulfate/molybdate transport systems ATPase subunit